jgi:hypothetical protein
MLPDPNYADDLENEILGPGDDVLPNRQARQGGETRPSKAQRLGRLPNPFVRVPIKWLTRPRYRSVFPPSTALFLYVLYRSHWGQRGVEITSAVAAQFGMTRRTKNKCILRWERGELVRVERRGRKAARVWPIVITG